MSGIVNVVTDHDEINEANNLMKIKLGIIDESRTVDYYCPPNLRRMYKLTVAEMWVNTRKFENNQWIDIRSEVTKM